MANEAEAGKPQREDPDFFINLCQKDEIFVEMELKIKVLDIDDGILSDITIPFHDVKKLDELRINDKGIMGGFLKRLVFQIQSTRKMTRID